MNLKKIGKVFTNKFFGTGPSSYEKKNLPGRGLTKVEKRWSSLFYSVLYVMDTTRSRALVITLNLEYLMTVLFGVIVPCAL